MFDGLGHGKPFLASNTGFFKEFSKRGQGIVTERNADSFEKGLKIVDENYKTLKSQVDEFRKKIKWDQMLNNILIPMKILFILKEIKTLN